MPMDITKIVVAVIGLMSTIVTVFLAPYLKTKWDVAKVEKLSELARRFVLAAEQLLGPGGGTRKKEKVQDWPAPVEVHGRKKRCRTGLRRRDIMYRWTKLILLLKPP